MCAPPPRLDLQAKAARTRSSRSRSAALDEIEPRAAQAMATAESNSSGGPTRLLLTHLHPSVSTSHLRAHLERCPSPSNAAGAITDLKVLSRPDGTSRCIAFAGFKRHSDADRVREWLDGTWLAGERGGARVKAEWAKEVRLNLMLECASAVRRDLTALVLPRNQTDQRQPSTE